MTDASHEPKELFGPYVLLDVLGRGPRATVWRAHDTHRDRIVALKIFAAHSGDTAFEQRFRRAMQALGRVTSAHVLPVHDFGVIDEQFFLDARLVEGCNLTAVFREHPEGLGTGRGLDLIGQVGAALSAAHDQGVVHGNLTPSNVLLQPTGQHEFCYVADFGSTHATVAGQAVDVSVAGDSSTSPEAWRGEEATPASDVYSLGCLLFQTLTGRPAFIGSPLELMHHHLFSPPPRASAVKVLLAPFDEIVAKAMAKHPGDRYSSVEEFIQAVRLATRSRRRPNFVPRLPRRDGLIMGAAGVALLLIGGGVLFAPDLIHPGPQPTASEPTPLRPPTAFHLPPGAASSGDIAISTDGQTLFTLRTGTDGALTIIDAPTGTVRSVVPVGINPEDVAVSPDGTRAYVVINGVPDAVGDTVVVVDTAAAHVVASVPVGTYPLAVRVSPDGHRVYAAHSGTLDNPDGGVTSIDTATNTVVGRARIAPVPDHFSVSPDGRFLYVPDNSSKTEVGSAVSVVDTATTTIARSLPVGLAPRATAVSPDGRHLWVAAAGTTKDDPRGALDSIDLDSGRTTTVAVDMINKPRGVAVTPDGSTVVVSDNGAPNGGAVPDNAVLVIDAPTGKVRRSVILDGEPKQIAISPDSRTAYISAMAPGDVWRLSLDD